MNDLKNIIESLLFVSDEPLTLAAIKSVVDIAEAGEIRNALKELIEEYDNRKGGFYLREIAGGYQFRTRPEHNDWIKRMLKPNPQRLSKAALESLAIIAYKQPIIRSDIEHIRGVDCGGVLRMLMERKLIRILGRKEIPGRPLIYATTKQFLEVFHLKDLRDLPSPKEIEELSRYADESGETQKQSALPFEEEAPEIPVRETDETAEDQSEAPDQLARKISEEAENEAAGEPSDEESSAEQKDGEAEDVPDDADRPTDVDENESRIAEDEPPEVEPDASQEIESTDEESDNGDPSAETGEIEPEITDVDPPEAELAAGREDNEPAAAVRSVETGEIEPEPMAMENESGENSLSPAPSGPDELETVEDNAADPEETDIKEVPPDDLEGKNA